MSIFLGIDPGAKGCLCVLGKDCEMIKDFHVFYDWPKDNDIQKYFDNIAHYLEALTLAEQEVKLAILERVHSMPSQGVASMFSFGVNYGRWLSFLDIYHVPYRTCPPTIWQKGLLSKSDGNDTKAQAFIAAKRLFPNAELNGPKGGVLSGRADALLIAYYASLQK